MSGGGKRRAPGRKSETFPLEQRGLRLDEWPPRDRAAWLAAVNRPEDPFETEGPAVSLAESTRGNRVSAWGNFLAFLASRERLDLDAAPGERATHENVTAWIQCLRGRMQANAVSRYVIEMALAIKAMEPSRDWAWIRRHPLRPRSAEAMASRKPVTPFDPGKLAAFLFETCEAVAPRPVNHDTARSFRDALMVLLDLYLGLRSANLAQLRIGVHLTEVGDTYRINLAPEETKAGKPVSSMVPAQLAVLLRTYVERYRPVLGEGKPATDLLWINRDGDPLSPYAIYGVFRRVGRQAGIELRPHLVRHTLATALMAVAPTNLGLAAAALTHRGARMVNEVYDRSGTEASHAMWRRLRRGLMRS